MRGSHPYPVSAWHLAINGNDELCIDRFPLNTVAEAMGTPVHVVHQHALIETARSFVASARAHLPGTVSTHYAFKCNSVPGIIDVLRESGLKAEVMTPADLLLAQHLGFRPEDIVVNGPCKTRPFLNECLRSRVRFIVIDSLDELRRLMELTTILDQTCEVLLRVNPDIIPGGMNAGSATGSRSGSAFGLDLVGREVESAFSWLRRCSRLRLAGFHLHIGTGLRTPADYVSVVDTLCRLMRKAQHDGFSPSVIDLGGGFCSPTSREFASAEMLLYQAIGRLPNPGPLGPSIDEFFSTIGPALKRAFGVVSAPEIILEPGRSLVSAAQMLLIRVEYIKSRPEIGTWAITDGGLGTVSMPTYYEYHEVFPCSGVSRPRNQRITILGPGCFAGDIVYRNKPMPALEAGEVLAIMDSGAYFTALESIFGHPRPPVAAVADDAIHVLRRRETFDDMMARDLRSVAVEEVEP